MSKWKDRVKKILDTEREKIEHKFLEAEGNYRDTGHGRYFNQMERYEKELVEIDDFLNSQLNVNRAESEARRYRKALIAFRQQMDDYILYHNGVDRPIDETVKALQLKLSTCLTNAGAKL